MSARVMIFTSIQSPFQIVRSSGFGEHLIEIEPWYRFSFDTSLKSGCSKQR